MSSLINLQKNNSIFVKCSCSDEILYIEYENDLKLADLCIYYRYNPFRTMSIWAKIRYIWQILIHSKPYSDQIVLTRKDLKDLSLFLKQIEE